MEVQVNQGSYNYSALTPSPTTITATLCGSGIYDQPHLTQACMAAFCTPLNPGVQPFPVPGYPLADPSLLTGFPAGVSPTCTATADMTHATSNPVSGRCLPTGTTSLSGKRSTSVNCVLAGRSCVPSVSAPGGIDTIPLTVTDSIVWVDPDDPAVQFGGTATSVVTETTIGTTTETSTQTHTSTATVIMTMTDTETLTGSATGTRTGTGTTTVTVTKTQTSTGTVTSGGLEQGPSVSGICNSLPVYQEYVTNTCLDLTKQSAYAYCANNWNFRAGFKDVFGYVKLGVTTPDDQNNCYDEITGTQQLMVTEKPYGLTPSAQVGVLSLGNQSARLRARAGYTVINTACGSGSGSGSGSGGSCTSPTLSRMKVMLEDVTLFGVKFSTPTLELGGSVDSSGGIIYPGTMQMSATTTVSGAVFQGQVTNPQNVSIAADSGALTLSGQMTMPVGNHADGSSLPLTIWVNLSASTSSPGATCVGLDHTGEILGFEDATLWQSSQTTLVLSSRVPTQGCFALDVPGSGYRVLNSVPFATPITGTTSNLGLDFFVPANPPNPSWLGAVQMYATCPSANMNNAYIGQVELTGKTVGAYSTLVFPIPSSIKAVLSQTHSDCFFSIAVNANQTPTAPTLDNLRFVP